ncbi:ABC transporter substrate-binding protein, partial [Paenibacillus sp. TAF58]
MQLLTHFLELRASFEHGVEHEPQPITLDELADRLYCTTRNVKILLKKMMEQGWVSWKPGRGRGNVSELTFLVSSEDMISKQAMELAGRGDYKGTIELIHQLGKGEGLQDSFIDWLFSFFGYRAVELEERYKDTLRFPVYKWFVTLDPAHSFYAFDCHLINQIFDTLIVYNPQTTISESIENMTVLNRSAIAIELMQPNVLFLQQLSHPSMAILPEDICRDNEGIFGRMPIGTGPFRLETNDDYICKLRAFDGYFGVRPHLDQVEIWLLPQDLSEVGPSWDMVQVLCDHTNSRKPVGAVGKDTEWHQIEQSILGCSLLTFNQNRKGPQQDTRFRKAIDLIMDRDRMIEELGGFREAPASSFLPTLDRKGAASGYRTDFAKAKRLLDEMGYGGEPLHMYIYSNNNEDALWICEQCSKIGIRIELTTRSKSDMMGLGTIQEADLIFYHICMESDYDLHII